GTVVELGPGVNSCKVGDRVMTLVGGGGYAEYAVAPASTLMPVPDGLDMIQAAALTEVWITAWLNVFREAALQPGETLLLHGGASGVATAAIQLAKALGPSPVIVTVGSPEKAAACRGLGADHAILYKEDDFAKRVLELTAGKGADVILDHIGASYLEPNLACLALYGRLVIIGLLGGAKAELNIGRLMVKRQRVIGSVLRARPVAEKAQVTQAFREQVLPRFATGELKPVIHAVLPLAEARRAHELMTANANTGKLVLQVDPSVD
ncbi:MAG TPA: NAD(P)H-quinone oxidoreductase, partial [Vicinamibacteria bacterium]|nr:NAD(P)H-quinone oxidoreductase [Vicinamibacteria bacterium]